MSGNVGNRWALGIAGSIIAMLFALVLALLERAYDHISTDHAKIFERLGKLEQRGGKGGDGAAKDGGGR